MKPKQIPNKFDFWKENKLAQHYQLSVEQIKQEFSKWIKTKEKAWIDYYPARVIVSEFIGSKEGLNSVANFETNPKTRKILVDDYETLAQILKPIIFNSSK